MAQKNKELDELKVDVQLVQKDIEVIKNNHLAHIEKDLANVAKSVAKIDTRLWAIAGMIIAACVAVLLQNLAN